MTHVTGDSNSAAAFSSPPACCFVDLELPFQHIEDLGIRVAVERDHPLGRECAAYEADLASTCSGDARNSRSTPKTTKVGLCSPSRTFEIAISADEVVLDATVV